MQGSIATSAYSRQITHRLLYDVVEFLEKYIEIAGYYPDWEQRKQIKDNKVVRPINGPEDAEECFSIVLLGFVGTMKSKPDFIREEIKKEFYEWIDATGIDVNNCHSRLKHCLFGISEVIEGRGKKIITDVINSKETLTPGTPEYARELGNIFVKIQAPLDNEREIEQSLKGRDYKDIEIKSKFGKGNSDKGREAFKRIAKNHDYQDFHFFPQQDQQIRNPNYSELTHDPSEKFVSSSSPTGITNQPIRWGLIIDISENKNDWEIRKAILIYDHYGNKEGNVLIRKNVGLGSHDYNQATGELINQPGKVYREDYFSIQEQAEIDAIFNLSQTTLQQQGRGHYQQSSKTSLNQNSFSQPQKDNNIGTGKIFGILGVFSILVISGVVLVRLKNKIKNK